MLTDNDRSAIDALRERLRESIVKGDVDEYVNCFAKDGFIMHPDTPQVRGRSAIRSYVAEFFGSFRVPTLELTPVIISGDEGCAYEVGVQKCVVEPEVPGFKLERQHLHVYEQSEDGTWYIAAAMSGNQ